MSSFFRSVSDSDDSSSDEEEELSSGSGSDSGLEQKQSKSKKKNDSDSGADSDSDDDSDDDQPPKPSDGPKKPSRFLMGADDSEDSDDEKTKVVKSAKSKRIEEVEASVKAIENASKINDWSAISNGASFTPEYSYRTDAPLPATQSLTSSYDSSPVRPTSPKPFPSATSKSSSPSTITSSAPREPRRR